MRTKLRSRFTLLFMTFAVLLAIPAIALADELRSNHNTFTTTASVLSLQSGGATDRVDVRLHQANKDNDDQCNVDSGETLTIKATTSNSTAATVKWANGSDTIAFVGCDGQNDARFLTVTSGSQGTANITFSIVTNTTGNGTYDLTTKAPFTVNVAPPPNTAPDVSVTGVQDGATYEHGAVPAAGCNVVDAEDTNESATPVKDSSGLNSNGLGLQTITCSYTDAGGLTTAARATYTIQDTTKPVIAAHDPVTAEATGANGAVVNYTNPTANDAVYGSVNVDCAPASGSQFALGSTTVTCNATDGSGNAAVATTFNVIVKDTTAPSLTVPSAPVVVEATGPTGAVATYQVTAKDAVDSAPSISCTPATGNVFGLGNTKVTCTAKDAAGNTSAAQSFDVIVKDTTAPALKLPADITEEATGPNGNVVNYSASASDLVSGNVNVTCTPASGSTFGITTTTVNCSASDAAGNKATGSFTVKVQDTIAPNNMQFVGNINDGDSFFFGDVPAQPTCSAADSGSGLNAAGCIVTGYSTAVGTHTLTATATDKAGNTATKTLSYSVKAWTTKGFYSPVDMLDSTGKYIVNTVKGGSTVPMKFELFKGLTELKDVSAIKSTTYSSSTYCSGALSDEIEVVMTGSTSLRFDATSDQFIYNWKTPTGTGCYKVTMTAQDGSTLIAYFKTR